MFSHLPRSVVADYIGMCNHCRTKRFEKRQSGDAKYEDQFAQANARFWSDSKKKKASRAASSSQKQTGMLAAKRLKLEVRLIAFSLEI